METAEPPVVLAVDPGSAKCGVAIVAATGDVKFRAIIPTLEIAARVRSLLLEYRPEHLVIGTGTGSKSLLRQLEAAGLDVPLCPVDESYTSEAARARFVAENPPRGLERLLPRSLRTPSIPYDDYVAIILAERFWTQSQGS